MWLPAGGKYHRGTIRKMQQPMPGPRASLEEHVNYDPFEALAVEWDRQGHSTDTSHDLVGTWEIEVSACLAALPTCKSFLK